MANNVPPAYGHDPVGNFFQFIFDGAPSSSSSASSNYEEGLSPQAEHYSDLYERFTGRQPGRCASTPSLQRAHAPSAAKYVWRRLVGGRQRHDAKARMYNLQADIIRLSQTMSDYFDRLENQDVIYEPLRKQHAMLYDRALLFLDARQRSVSLMYTFHSYDKSLHDSFLKLDMTYRTSYAELVELEVDLHNQRAVMKRIIADMNELRSQAMGIVGNLKQLQEVYVGYYGRLPHSMSDAETLGVRFGVPKLDAALEPLPAPDLLPKMPWHFAPPPPPPRAKSTRKHSAHPRPQPAPESKPTTPQAPPRPPQYVMAEDSVAEGATVVDRIAPALEKIFGGDTEAWSGVTQQDLAAIELALRRSNLRVDHVDSTTASVRQHVALKVLGDPDASSVRLRYRKRQMVVHPDKTGGLPTAARAKADALCKILSAALDELTQG